MQMRPKPKTQAKLPRIFDCPKCNSKAAILITINLKKERASLNCRVCNERYTTAANRITEEIDIFVEWNDMMDSQLINPIQTITKINDENTNPENLIFGHGSIKREPGKRQKQVLKKPIVASRDASPETKPRIKVRDHIEALKEMSEVRKVKVSRTSKQKVRGLKQLRKKVQEMKQMKCEDEESVRLHTSSDDEACSQSSEEADAGLFV